jgi:hypothetical protein
MQRREKPGRFAQAPLGVIALHRASDSACGGETQADVDGAVLTIPRLDDDGAPWAGQTLGGGEEIRPLLQSLHGADRFSMSDRDLRTGSKP